ncbi:hypothetical protein GCM10023187_53370 [Nibrella viscosa]|uniref:Phosphonate transport system substrate-binding protein n=1 Tax=Nibrella viscosa TaxID=1084524 RepID=A0ABP8KZF6_9BACT
MNNIYQLSYYPWITQHKTPEVIRQNIDVFARALQEELSKSTGQQVLVNVLPAMEVPQQILSLAQNQSHIALMNPLGFIYARQRNNQINAAAVALRIIDGNIGDSYFAQIYTHVDTGIKDLPALRKRSIGYGSSQSTSNFIIPAFELKQAGIHPFAAFRRMEFVGGHDRVAMAVYNRQIDAGAGHDGVIIDLAGQAGYSDAKEKLITLHRSKPIPSDPVAVNVSTSDEYNAIQKALVLASLNSPAKEAISEFWGNAQGLRETTYQPYEYLLNAVGELGLTEKDIFG